MPAINRVFSAVTAPPLYEAGSFFIYRFSLSSIRLFYSLASPHRLAVLPSCPKNSTAAALPGCENLKTLREIKSSFALFDFSSSFVWFRNLSGSVCGGAQKIAMQKEKCKNRSRFGSSFSACLCSRGNSFSHSCAEKSGYARFLNKLIQLENKCSGNDFYFQASFVAASFLRFLHFSPPLFRCSQRAFLHSF
jgi:hypothetical protein